MHSSNKSFTKIRNNNNKYVYIKDNIDMNYTMQQNK